MLIFQIDQIDIQIDEDVDVEASFLIQDIDLEHLLLCKINFKEKDQN